MASSVLINPSKMTLQYRNENFDTTLPISVLINIVGFNYKI